MHKNIDEARDKDPKRKGMHQNIDNVRNKKPERISQKQNVDEVRDKTPKRKKMHQNIDKVRDKTPKRQNMHKRIDRIRDQQEDRQLKRKQYEHTKTRRRYMNVWNKSKYQTKYQKKLSMTLALDTGFNVICSSCLEYKPKEYCKSINKLEKENYEKFIVRFCSLLKNRTDGHFICNLCFHDIKNKKIPKRNKKNNFKFANFPRQFIINLKQKCKFKEKRLKSNSAEEKENYEREYLQLNRLEAFLLKLIIPFIRIAHCPRGPFLKVKGDLILISSDIDHSMSKVLPVQQSLIPVCFKRKLSYSGSYIEEYVEKQKVKMYFEWFKKHNHLFKDIEFEDDQMMKFENESILSAEVFEQSTKGENENHISDNEDEESTDDVHEKFCNIGEKEVFEPLKSDEVDWQHHQTTMFLNKYCEDPNSGTVVNQMAEMIVDYETYKDIQIDNDDDFEIDNEIITEEEFLRNVDNIHTVHNEEYEDKIIQITDQLSDSEDDQVDELEETLQNFKSSHQPASDEIHNNLNVLNNPSKDESELIADKSRKQAEKVMEKMEKICVAPGEEGGFKNWGKDIYLEEKSFPEKFPYGSGGYLSSSIDDPENSMGFANYCKNQLMSADPKFRRDPTYIFFILLVKELIQLKRCKTTYFRQARRLPNLKKQDVCNIDPSNLSRYNRSFQKCPRHIDVL